MAGRDPFDKLTGLAALSEIGRRLDDLGAQVKGALKDGQSGERSFTLNAAKDGVTHASFRVRSLADAASGNGRPRTTGTPRRAERPRSEGPDVDIAREPMVDCFDEGDAFLITAELPGVRAGEISLSIADDALLIETTGARRYRTRQPLLAAVDPASLIHDLRNGILEARVAKSSTAKPRTPEGAA